MESLPILTIFFTIVCLCIITLWNHLLLFPYCLLVYDCTVKSLLFWPLFHYSLLVYDCTVKSLPFLTTFSLLFACVWLHCEITAVFYHFFTIDCLCMIALWNHCRFWPLFYYRLLVYDCTVKSPPFMTTFPLLSAIVWLHCEITAVFDHFFTTVYLCIIALWNHRRFWPLFSYCLPVYDCTVKLQPFLTSFLLLSICEWLHCEITAVFDHFLILSTCQWLHCEIMPFFKHFSLMSICV